MVALVKLKSYGMTEENILNLNYYLERNMMNSKTSSTMHPATTQHAGPLIQNSE
jgi:hypothetical protein